MSLEAGSYIAQVAIAAYPNIDWQEVDGLMVAIGIISDEFPAFLPSRDVYPVTLREGASISIGMGGGGGRRRPLFGLRKTDGGSLLISLRMDGKDRRTIVDALSDGAVAHDLDIAWDAIRRSASNCFMLTGMEDKAGDFRGLIQRLKRGAPDVVQHRMRWGAANDVACIEEDVKEVVGDATMRKQLVMARIGQGEFRRRVLQCWNSRCAVTGVTELSVIKASHIKPWRDSSDEERLSADNGIALVATLDALFDAFLISFDQDGGIVISSRLSADDLRKLRITETMKLLHKPSQAQRVFLRAHLKRLEYFQ